VVLFYRISCSICKSTSLQGWYILERNCSTFWWHHKPFLLLLFEFLVQAFIDCLVASFQCCSEDHYLVNSIFNFKIYYMHSMEQQYYLFLHLVGPQSIPALQSSCKWGSSILDRSYSLLQFCLFICCSLWISCLQAVWLCSQGQPQVVSIYTKASISEYTDNQTQRS